MPSYTNREDAPCAEGECKHAYDDWPADSVTKRDRDYDQCENCGWTATEVEQRAKEADRAG
jgi:hypothetical protein